MGIEVWVMVSKAKQEAKNEKLLAISALIFILMLLL